MKAAACCSECLQSQDISYSTSLFALPPIQPKSLTVEIGSGKWVEKLIQMVDEANIPGQQNPVVIALFVDASSCSKAQQNEVEYELSEEESYALNHAREQGVLFIGVASHYPKGMAMLLQVIKQFDNVITIDIAAKQKQDRNSEYLSKINLLIPEEAITQLFPPGLVLNRPELLKSIAANQALAVATQVWMANPHLSYRQVSDVLKAATIRFQLPNWQNMPSIGIFDEATVLNAAQTLTTNVQNEGRIVVEQTVMRAVASASHLTLQSLRSSPAFSPLSRNSGEDDYGVPDDPAAPSGGGGYDPGGGGGGSGGSSSSGGGGGSGSGGNDGGGSDGGGGNPDCGDMDRRSRNISAFLGSWDGIYDGCGANWGGGYEQGEPAKPYGTLPTERQGQEYVEVACRPKFNWEVYWYRYRASYISALGYCHSQGDGGAPPPPPPPPPPPFTLTFLQKLRKVINVSISRLDPESAASLRSQTPVIMEMGRIVDSHEWYVFVGNGIAGLFNDVNDIYDYPGIQLVADKFSEYVQARRSLYSIQTVKGLILPAKILTAAKVTSALSAYLEDREFVSALRNLGLAYGALDPQGEPSEHSFIHLIWRATSEGGFSLGGQKLADFLVDLIEFVQPTEPARFLASALRLITNLLQSVRLIPAIETQSHDAEFLRRVVEFGKAYMMLSPDSVSDEDQWLNFCLNTLSGDSSTVQLSKGSWEFGYYLAVNDKPEQMLELGTNLLKVAQKILLPEERHNPRFLAALVGLGRDYAVLNPGATSNLGLDTPTSFINTLWLAPSNSGLRQAARELQVKLADIHDAELSTRSLRFGRRLLKTMQNYSNLPNQNPTFLAELLEVGRIYAVLNPWLPDDFETNPINSFLSTMWKAKYEDEIQQSSDEFGQFFAQFSEFDLQMQLVKMSRNLLQAAHRSPRTELKVEKHNARFLTGIVELGREYAEMEPGEASLASTENPSTFFLDTFWRSPVLGSQKGQEEFNAFFKDIRRPSQTVQLERHLLEAVRQSLALEEAEQKKDAALLRELLELGRVYATLNPIDLLETAEPANFFLNTLWTAKDATAVQTGGAEFESFIGDFEVDQRVQLLRLEWTFLSVAKTSTDLRRTLRDPRVVRELVGLGALYTKLYSDAEEPEDSGMFLDMLWHHPDQSLSIASLEFNRLVTDVKGVRLNREAIFLGIRLLLAARNISEWEPNLGDVQPKLRLLLQPLAHVASAYTALNPQKNSGTRSFVQTAWKAKNDATEQDFILQSSEELREFLAGSAEQPRFKINEQPQVLDFVAKLLQAAKLSTKLSARQKRDSAILKMAFVDAARDAAKFHLTYPRGTGDDVTFWDRFWQAAVSDSGTLQQGVRELDQYLTELGLPIETMGYIGKLWFALSMVGEKLGDDFQQIIRDIRENLGTILLILGIVGILLLIPVVNVGIDLFLAILEIVFTVVSGVESIQAFFDFLVQVWQAEDEAGLELAAESLSRAILAGIGTLIGLAGFFKSLKVIKESAIAIKALSLNVINLARRLPEKFPALLEFFQLCWRAPGAIVIILRDFSSDAFRRLVQFAEYLNTFGDELIKFLREAPNWINNFLESLNASLSSATKLVDRIWKILNFAKFDFSLTKKVLNALNNDSRLIDRLLSQNQSAISDFIELVKIIDNDIEAMESLVSLLNSGRRVSNDRLSNIFSELLEFMSRSQYKGRVFGDLASRFWNAQLRRGGIQARGEISLAEDLLEGRTPLGPVRTIRGLVSPRDAYGSEIQGLPLPEYRVVDRNNISRLVETKTLNSIPSERNVRSNLRDAISQINNEVGSGYIRINGSYQNPTQMTVDDFYRIINGQLRNPQQRGMESVEFVEIIYRDSSGLQTIVYQVQQGNVVRIR